MTKDKMVRKQIYLEANQNELIKLLANRKGKTEAEIIREAVDRYMTEKNVALEDPLEELIGMIDNDQIDGSTMHDQTIYHVEENHK